MYRLSRDEEKIIRETMRQGDSKPVTKGKIWRSMLGIAGGLAFLIILAWLLFALIAGTEG